MSTGWIADADYMDIDSIELKNIYKNYPVRDYLENANKLGIASTKGVGKTFLLKAKRLHSQSKGEICYPQDNMLNVIIAPSIHSNLTNYFEDYSNWILLWESAIVLSIFSHYPKDKGEVFKNSPYHKQLLDLTSSGEVSFYFSKLISSDSRKLLVNLKYEAALALDEIHKIQNSICIFIDRIDQAFENQVHQIPGQTKMSSGNRNASFWQYAQLSLAQAAYQIRAVNQHVKVYYAIRKEAMKGAEAFIEEYQNFHGSIVSLNYSREELEEMMNIYIQQQEDCNLIKAEYKYTDPQYAFFGMKTIPHVRIQNEREKCFDYLLRHTLGRPRDIMMFCNDITTYGLKRKNRKQVLRSRINICSKNLLESYLFQTERFLFNINTEDLNVLFDLIQSNKITLKMLKSICNQFNRYFEDKYGDSSFDCSECNICEKLHPFCQLYNVGLLGVVANDRTIRFKHISEGLLEHGNHFLPYSQFYYLHSAVANKVQLIRESKGKNFLLSNEIVGHRNRIKYDLPRINKKNIKANKVFISSTCYDLARERTAIREKLISMGYDVVQSDANGFNTRVRNTHIHDHCIKEALKCKKMVFVIGERYGSEYLGTEYKKEKTELVLAGISNPSISLMEYYVASKHKLDIYVFFKKGIMDAKCEYKNTNTNTSQIDVNVFSIMDFISKQINNSWMKDYEDIENLKELVFINMSKLNK